jgi:hypothetical protein
MTYQNESDYRTPSSILDIITSGYKSAFKTLWPVTRLTLPGLFLYGISGGLYHAKSLQMQGSKGGFEDLMSFILIAVLFMLSSFLYSYMHYCVARFISDVYWRDAQQNESTPLFSYLLPKKNIWGTLGITLLTMVAFVPIGIIGIIGLLFLVVPGVAIFSYSIISSSLIYVAYLGQSEQGVFETCSQCFQLLRGNFWRTVGLGVTSWLIYLIMSSPVMVFNFALSFMAQMSPSFANSMLFPILYAIVYTIICAFAMAVGYAGTLHILNRYYFDLRSRQEALE